MIPAAAALDAFLFALAVYLYVIAGRYAAFASPGSVGPEFWPRVALGMMALAAAADLVLGFASGRFRIGIRTAAKAAEETGPDISAKATRRGTIAVLAAMLLLMAYVAALPYVGFLLASLVFVPVMLWISGYRNVPVILFLTIVGPAVVAFTFQRLLQIVFPIGTGVFEHITVSVYRALHIY